MGEVKLRCPTCGAEPRIYLERDDSGEMYLAGRCECGNYVPIEIVGDLDYFLRYWEEVGE